MATSSYIISDLRNWLKNKLSKRQVRRIKNNIPKNRLEWIVKLLL